MTDEEKRYVFVCTECNGKNEPDSCKLDHDFIEKGMISVTMVQRKELKMTANIPIIKEVTVNPTKASYCWKATR